MPLEYGGLRRSNRQRVSKDIARIPAGLDSLEPGIVASVVEIVPPSARCIQRLIGEVGVGMVDQRSVVRLARYRNSARLGEQLLVECAHPIQILVRVPRI